MVGGNDESEDLSKKGKSELSWFPLNYETTKHRIQGPNLFQMATSLPVNIYIHKYEFYEYMCIINIYYYYYMYIYEKDWTVSPQYTYTEALTFQVIIFGDQVF